MIFVYLGIGRSAAAKAGVVGSVHGGPRASTRVSAGCHSSSFQQLHSAQQRFSAWANRRNPAQAVSRSCCPAWPLPDLRLPLFSVHGRCTFHVARTGAVTTIGHITSSKELEPCWNQPTPCQADGRDSRISITNQAFAVTIFSSCRPHLAFCTEQNLSGTSQPASHQPSPLALSLPRLQHLGGVSLDLGAGLSYPRFRHRLAPERWRSEDSPKGSLDKITRGPWL